MHCSIFEDAMADVVAHSTQPALGAIKLAWWRERLEELDDGKIASRAAACKAAAANCCPEELAALTLARLEEGWAALLRSTNPISAEVGFGQRTRSLFEIGARLLDVRWTIMLEFRGRLLVAADLARRGSTGAARAW